MISYTIKNQTVNYIDNLRWEKTISKAQNAELCKSTSPDEIKDALWSIGVDKAPGSDGFNATFYRRKWETIRKDLVDCVRWFLEEGKMVCQVNHAFLVLIPKKKITTSLGDLDP